MKVISITRDHREVFTSRELNRVERFVGKGGQAFEKGIDDQYTLFYFSRDCDMNVISWVLNNKYTIWHLLSEGVEFDTLDDLVDKLNVLGREFADEDWDDLTTTK